MGNVTVIPARRQVGNTARQQEEKPKLRVAAYCRVSTDSDEQATSYEAQVEHYTEYMDKIAVGLERDGVLTGAGKTKWHTSTINKILRNGLACSGSSTNVGSAEPGKC